MKYCNNHEEEFSSPYCAFLVGFMQFVCGIIAETCCCIYLSSLNSPIDVIIRFMALTAVANVDEIVFRAFGQEQRILKKLEPLKISAHRRDFASGKLKRPEPQRFLRMIYKTLRVFFASFQYYFFPFVILIIPVLAYKLN